MGRHSKPPGTREKVLDRYRLHKSGECHCSPTQTVEQSRDAKFPHPTVIETWPREHVYWTGLFAPESPASREEARRLYLPHLEPEQQDTSHVELLKFVPTLQRPRNND